MLLNDTQISQLDNELAAERGQGLFTPFVPYSVKSNDLGEKLISYGLSSTGYDIRAADAWEIFQPNGELVDPKHPNPDHWLKVSGNGYVDIPSQGYALTYSVERFNFSNIVMGLVVGKSTYARSGIIINCTPAEPGWAGHLTIEIKNSLPAPVRVYANEGIAQVLLFQVAPVGVSYADRGGKYQDQPAEIIHSKME